MHRDFDAAATPDPSAEPITFTLAGRQFTRRTELPLGALVAAGRAVRLAPMEQFVALVEVVRSWIIPAERDAFDDALLEIDNFGVLADIVAWLMEQSTGRPTPASSSS